MLSHVTPARIEQLLLSPSVAASCLNFVVIDRFLPVRFDPLARLIVPRNDIGTNTLSKAVATAALPQPRPEYLHRRTE